MRVVQEAMKKQYGFSAARKGAILPVSQGKTRITIRIDDDVLEWFRAEAHATGGASYQTMMNDALRRRMEARTEVRRGDAASRDPKGASQAAKGQRRMIVGSDTEELLGARGARGSRRGFLAALAKVPDAPADAGDELPSAARLRKPATRRPSKKTG